MTAGWATGNLKRKRASNALDARKERRRMLTMKTKETVRLNIKVDSELHRRLRVCAAERGTTSQEIVTELLRSNLAPLRGTGETEKTEK